MGEGECAYTDEGDGVGQEGDDDLEEFEEVFEDEVED